MYVRPMAYLACSSVPYIIFELPSNIVLRKVGAKYWLSFIVLAFGVIMTGMAFVKTWEQLAACRVLLGFFEAGFFPAVRAPIPLAWFKCTDAIACSSALSSSVPGTLALRPSLESPYST